MICGIVIGLVLGWLIAGAIVLRCAFRGDEAMGPPVGLGDVAVIIGGVLLWPMLLYPDEGDDA